MGMMRTALQWLSAQMPGRAHPSSLRPGLVRPESGVWIDHEVALTYGAFFAAVRIIAETLGILGMHLYERTAAGGKRRVEGVPLDQILRRRWNPTMSAQTGVETITAHAVSWGNGYAEIERDVLRRPVALWPLLPDRTWPEWQDEQLVYRHRPARGEVVTLPASDVLHVHGVGWDGLVGYDLVSYCARTLGGGLAAEKFAGSFFGNGTHLSGGLFHKGTLSAAARAKLREEFEAVYRGPDNALRIAVFEEGMEWKQFSIDPKAAQLIETRKVNVQDIARWFRIPPHKLGDLEKATWANIEHQEIEFVTDALLPWVTRWEQEVDAKLAPPGRFCKANVKTLLRGDAKSRNEAYAIGRQWGWLSVNDIREWEDMDLLPAEVGDVYIVPANFQAAERLLTPAPAQDPGAEPSGGPDVSIADPVLQAAAARLESREYGRLGRASEGDATPAARAARIAKVTGELARDAPEILGPPAGVLGAMLGLSAEAVDAIVAAIARAHAERRAAAWMSAHGTGAPPAPESGLVAELKGLLVGAAGLGGANA